MIFLIKNCRYVARPFAMIGARSSRYIVAFLLAASQSWRARSQQTAEQQIRKFPISHPILTSSPVTAALGVENGRTESLREEPSPESNDLAASRLRTRETNISPCVGLAPSLNMRTRKKEQLLYYTAVIAHGF